MSRFRITNTQLVTYTWTVEAADHLEAMETLEEGIPAYADSRILRSESDAEELGTNPAYPNGRCAGCGFGRRDDGTCQNPDCAHYVIVVGEDQR